MTKTPKDLIRRYASGLRGVETRSINKRRKRTVERLPAPISAHGDAVVTIVGTNFGDRSSWGPAFRLVLVIPPTFVGPPRVEALTLGDCLTWLEGFSNSLAVRLEEPCTGRLYRMVAALEGSPCRGWFFTIILDLPRAAAIPFDRFREITLSAKPRHCLIHVTECHGLIETTHLLGRLGLISVLDHVD
jgi:hypothetical protein